jgi:hypothetical protein
MLLVGNYECIPHHINGLVMFNLSSLREGYERLNLLPPTTQDYNYYDEKNFDLQYANHILTNESLFLELMKIIYALYEGKDVYILVTRDEFFDMVTESLIKFIQQRYGYISSVLNEPSDIDYVDREASFSIQGVFNLDQDKERLSYHIGSEWEQKQHEIEQNQGIGYHPDSGLVGLIVTEEK